MTQFELLVVLLAAAIPLVLLANRIRVAYPILLVLAGLGVGFIPGVPDVTIPPELILVIFLPPLLTRKPSMRRRARSASSRRRSCASRSDSCS